MKYFMWVVAVLAYGFMGMISTAQAAEPVRQPGVVEVGLVNKKSPYSVSETLDRLEAILTKKGITIVVRWKHDEAARKASIPLRATELLVFGNPKLGSHLFTSNQLAGIDLPMKALAWEDVNGQVWLSYNNPAYIVARHRIRDRDAIVAKMSAALNKLTNAALAP